MRSSQTWDRRSARTTAVVLSALILSGCHSRVPIGVPDSTPPPPTAAVLTELKVGDQVRVTLRNGSVVESVVADLQAEALVAGDGRRFPYADMARLERIRVSPAKTAALVGGLLLIVFFLAYGAAVGSLAGGM